MLKGRDLIGQAQTGTGKTAAFALPILQQLKLDNPAVQALVLTPTRELAIQVAEAIHTYSKRLGHVRALPVYGGSPMSQQIRRLKQGVHVVVGTPGRIMDHLGRQLAFVAADLSDESMRCAHWLQSTMSTGSSPDPASVRPRSSPQSRPIRRSPSVPRDPERIEIDVTALSAVIEAALSERQRATESRRLTLCSKWRTRSRRWCSAHESLAADVAGASSARLASEAMHATDEAHAASYSSFRASQSNRRGTDVAARGLDGSTSATSSTTTCRTMRVYVQRTAGWPRGASAGPPVRTPRERVAEIIEDSGVRISAVRMPSTAASRAPRSLFKDPLRAAAKKMVWTIPTIGEALAEEGST